MASPKRDRRQDDPIERLKRLRPEDVDQQALADLLHEFQVHQAELEAQNSQLVETQHALEESRDRLVDLYEFAPIGYMAITAAGVVLEMNLTGAALLRKERGKIIGHPFSAFVAKADKVRFSEHLRQGRLVDRSNATVELELNTSDAPCYVQLVTRRRGTDREAASTFVTALIDITERKRLEDEHRAAEDARDKLFRERETARARADAKDHFLATLSHELRTPLTPVVATLSNQRLIAMAPEPLASALQTVRRNLDLEVRLIDDLLDVTRISRHRLVLAQERVNLHLVLQDVVDMLGHEIRKHDVHVVTALEAPTDWVIGDATRLRQVFWNLLGNALKFTSGGGRVTITSAAGHDGFIQVTVSDTGAGMNETLVRSINESGQDARSEPLQSTTGLGLGLAICRGVVAAHDGTLTAMSAGPGRGSTFVVQIPIAAHLERWDSESSVVEPHDASPARAGRILLVEDHQDSADTLSQLLN